MGHDLDIAILLFVTIISSMAVLAAYISYFGETQDAGEGELQTMETLRSYEEPGPSKYAVWKAKRDHKRKRIKNTNNYLKI